MAARSTPPALRQDARITPSSFGTDDRRAAALLDQAGRHEADHADRPGPQDDRGRAVAGLRSDRRTGLNDGLAGHDPAVEVVGLEPIGQLGRLERVIGQEKGGCVGRTADAAGGIEPGRNDERDGLEIGRGR